jgi:hypothetical protein
MRRHSKRLLAVVGAVRGNADTPEGAKAPSVVRNFRLDAVLEKVRPHDCVLAKQEGPSLYSYAGFPGASTTQVAVRMLEVPQAERHLHTVFGRDAVKCDLVLDLDFALCLETKKSKDFYTGESVLLETILATQEHYVKGLKLSKPTDIVVLDGHSTKKHSYHVHIRSADGMFVDYQAARDAASDINAVLTKPVIDIGSFRPKATMRIAFTPKFTERSRILLPLKTKDAELKRLLKDMSELSDVDIVERSLVVNHSIDAGMKAIKGKSGSKSMTFDEFGSPVPAFLVENKKWMRFGEAVAAIKRLPVKAADDYAYWIRVGLALHSFSADTHVLDVWKNFSARCRHKYKPEVNDAYWIKFGRRPNAFNWRRGYYYLTRTVGKQLHE